MMAKILMEFNPSQEILYFLETSQIWKNQRNPSLAPRGGSKEKGK